MTNDIVPFDFQGHQVRVVTDERGEAWWIAKDVCDVLGLGNVGQALAGLDDDEKSNISSSDVGQSGGRDPFIVSEPGLYSLILRSRKPEAKAFKRWITHEVIPSIRRTGSYAAPTMTGPELMAHALIEAQRTIEAHAAAVAELTPKAEAWDVMVSANGDYAVDEAAKILSRDAGIIIGRNRLFALMADMSWVYRSGARGRWHARQEQVDLGRLVERMSAAFLNAKTGEMEVPAPTIRITPKGLDALRKRMKEAVA